MVQTIGPQIVLIPSVWAVQALGMQGEGRLSLPGTTKWELLRGTGSGARHGVGTGMRMKVRAGGAALWEVAGFWPGGPGRRRGCSVQTQAAVRRSQTGGDEELESL